MVCSKVTLLSAVLAVALRAQQAVPPAGPAAGTALEQTMKSLEGELAAIARVNFSLHYRDTTNGQTWVEKESPEVSKVRTSVADCRIDYDWRWVMDGQLALVQHSSIPLKESQGVEVLPAEEASRQADARAGHPQWAARAEPPVFVVRVDRAGTENNFPFYDEGLAKRVAGELTRAAELCGGRAAAARTTKGSSVPPEDASLEVTLKWIADALGDIGPVNYVAYQHLDSGRASRVVSVSRFSVEYTNLRASAAQCRMDWHARTVRDGKAIFDGAVGLALKDVRQVAVLPLQETYRETDQKHWRPGASYRVVPETSVLRIRSKSGEDIAFPLQDSGLAVKIAGAVSQAVAGCGGGLGDVLG